MRSETTASSPLLLGITAMGFLGVTATYLTAGPERFWANWLLWFLFVFTLALGCLFLVARETWWRRVGACPSGACRNAWQRFCCPSYP